MSPLFAFAKLTWNPTQPCRPWSMIALGGKLACSVLLSVGQVGVCFLEHLAGPPMGSAHLELSWPCLFLPCRRTAAYHQAEALEPLWRPRGKVRLAPWRCCTVYRFPDPHVRNGSWKTSLSWRMPSASLVEFLADSTNRAFWASKCFPVHWT